MANLRTFELSNLRTVPSLRSGLEEEFVFDGVEAFVDGLVGGEGDPFAGVALEGEVEATTAGMFQAGDVRVEGLLGVRDLVDAEQVEIAAAPLRADVDDVVELGLRANGLSSAKPQETQAKYCVITSTGWILTERTL